MTPQERAEKIFIECMVIPEVIEPIEVQHRIAAQIEEAERELMKHPHWWCLPCSTANSVSHAEGFNIAKEKAAKIVEGFNLPNDNEFYWYKQQESAAKTIRAMKIEEKK